MKNALYACLFTVLLAGCSSQAVKVGEDDSEIIDSETISIPMPEGKTLVDPVHGEEQWFGYGAMQGVGDSPANGVAMAYFFADGTFAATMQLNIAPEADGTFYEAWVEKDGAEPVSVGHLQSPFNDSRHMLRGKKQEDLRSHDRIFVTLERDDGNPAPATTVAEGILKHVDR